MKRNVFDKAKGLTLLLLTFFSISVTSILNEGQAQVSNKDGLIKERRFQRLIDKENVVLIDVRTEEEYAAGHIPYARLLDVQQKAFADSIQTLDRSKTYLLYCRSGKRSQKAIELFQANGFKKVYHLKGGFSNWNGSKE